MLDQHKSGNDRDSRRREFPAPGEGLSPFPAPAPAKYGDPGR